MKAVIVMLHEREKRRETSPMRRIWSQLPSAAQRGVEPLSEASATLVCCVVCGTASSTPERHPTHILHPAGLVESQILVQAKPDIIPVQPISMQTLVQQVLLESRSNGRLSISISPTL